MSFVQGEKGYCTNEADQEDDEEVITGITRNFPFSSSSSSASPKYKDIVPHHQNLWLGTSDSRQDYRSQESAINFDKKLELMDLSLGSNNNNEETNSSRSIEKEHMFDKVVTPSDVGKLNRLVIPKQHAEKYFPLDSSSNEKGLLLNFEDRNGKSWRFRYSYWNSSQSYVMTKGWSRFVKEKKLDAGDIVSFQRGVGESGKGQLYIDWRRRPTAPDPTSLAHIQLQNQFSFPPSVRWGRLYSLPQSMCVSANYEPLHRLNYSIYPYNHHHHHQQQQQLLQQLQIQQQQQAITFGNVAQYYRRSSGSHHQHQHQHRQIGAVQDGAGGEPMVIDSVPVVPGTNKTAAKRLRLFGVNMDCPPQDESSSSTFPRATTGSGSDDSPQYFSSSSLQSRLFNNNNNNNNTRLSGTQAEIYSKKGKSSLSIDLDL
ncbi:hypothetical protein PTKIN_Ptkin12aG0159900 [Pterospermum kingtungense]